MLLTAAPLRFRFVTDPAPDGLAEMCVTYVGRISRKVAEADARRRFEEWRTLPHLAKARARDQLVVS